MPSNEYIQIIEGIDVEIIIVVASALGQEHIKRRSTCLHSRLIEYSVMHTFVVQADKTTPFGV